MKSSLVLMHSILKFYVYLEVLHVPSGLKSTLHGRSYLVQRRLLLSLRLLPLKIQHIIMTITLLNSLIKDFPIQK